MDQIPQFSKAKQQQRIEKSGHFNSRVKLYWKSDLNKDVIIQNFTDRFWEEDEMTHGIFIGQM